MIKKISAVIFILLGLLIIFNLGKQIATALNSANRLNQEVVQLNNLQDENQQLRTQLSQVESYDYLEQTARNGLNMSKPGETVIVIPQQSIDHILGLDKKPPPPPPPNWQRWARLIFHV